MNLEDIVPPLELCKRIPAPRKNFRDSLFAWVPRFEGRGEWRRIFRYDLCSRPAVNDSQCIPAPTLAEIMAGIVKLKDLRGLNNHVHLKWDREAWRIDSYDDGYHVIETHDITNPATAALKLWLELKGIEA